MPYYALKTFYSPYGTAIEKKKLKLKTRPPKAVLKNWGEVGLIEWRESKDDNDPDELEDLPPPTANEMNTVGRTGDLGGLAGPPAIGTPVKK